MNYFTDIISYTEKIVNKFFIIIEIFDIFTFKFYRHCIYYHELTNNYMFFCNFSIDLLVYLM